MELTTTLSLVKTAAEISKKLDEMGRNMKDRDLKQQIEDIQDRIRELKQSASELEDENRDLREKLRFKSDDFEFRNPFWYEKSHPDRALCPKCFSKQILGPMGDPGQKCEEHHRRCLACEYIVEIAPRRPSPSHVAWDGGGPNSWMR